MLDFERLWNEISAGRKSKWLLWADLHLVWHLLCNKWSSLWAKIHTLLTIVPQKITPSRYWRVWTTVVKCDRWSLRSTRFRSCSGRRCTGRRLRSPAPGSRPPSRPLGAHTPAGGCRPPPLYTCPPPPGSSAVGTEDRRWLDGRLQHKQSNLQLKRDSSERSNWFNGLCNGVKLRTWSSSVKSRY